MITDENKKKKIIPSICRFFDWQFWATIDMKLKKKKRFSGTCKVLYDDRQWNGVCSNENLSVSYPFNGDIFLFSCNIYLLMQSHNLFVMRLNKESENKRMKVNTFLGPTVLSQCLITSLNENRWLVRSIAWVPVFGAVDLTTTQGLD